LQLLYVALLCIALPCFVLLQFCITLHCFALLCIANGLWGFGWEREKVSHVTASRIAAIC
jgi:hypothetical protein